MKLEFEVLDTVQPRSEIDFFCCSYGLTNFSLELIDDEEIEEDEA